MAKANPAFRLGSIISDTTGVGPLVSPMMLRVSTHAYFRCVDATKGVIMLATAASLCSRPVSATSCPLSRANSSVTPVRSATVAIAPPECGPVRCSNCRALWLQSSGQLVAAWSTNAWQKDGIPSTHSPDAVHSPKPSKRKTRRPYQGSPGVARQPQLKRAAVRADARSTSALPSTKFQEDLARLVESLNLPRNYPASNALAIDRCIVDRGPVLSSKAIVEEFFERLRPLSERKGASSQPPLRGAKKSHPRR